MSKPFLASEAVTISIDVDLGPSGYAAMEKVFSKIRARAKLGYRSIPVEKLHITVVEKSNISDTILLKCSGILMKKLQYQLNGKGRL